MPVKGGLPPLDQKSFHAPGKAVQLSWCLVRGRVKWRGSLCVASVVRQVMYWTIVRRNELGPKTNLSIYQFFVHLFGQRLK